MFLRALRVGLGNLIVFADWVSRPRPAKLTDNQKAHIQKSLSGLSLYQLHACPFCVKTRRAMHKLNIQLDIHDIRKQPEHREALESGGGRVKVPCLRIEEQGQVKWMYESNDIIDYLQNHVNRVLSTAA